jgi:ribosomal protein L32
MPEGDKTRKLFAQFMRLRQNGTNRDDAWRSLEKTVNTLSASERERLVKMLRNWEIAEGGAHESAPDPFETLAKPSAKLVEKRNVIRRIKPAETSITQPVMVECPSCHKPNQPGTVHCFSCGTILLSAPDPATGTQPLLDRSDMDSAFFGENWVLYLKVQGTTETLRVQPRQTEIIFGRKSPDCVMIPDVDLTPYEAGERGVSRLHASLRRQDQTLVLSDLGSVNHTFINGQRVHAHEVRVLHDGDEIRLGRLLMYAYFRES